MNNIVKNEVRIALDQLNFPIDDSACEQLTQYLQGMLLWNRAYNLTAITDPKEMIIKHLLDSLVLVPELRQRFQSAALIDVGTGAGLPGIPLSIVLPDFQFTLLDSATKRTRFIQQMKIEIGLPNVTVVTSRVQDYQPNERFDGVLSRAFASGNDMVKWSQHLLKEGGMLIAMKGKVIHSEWEDVTDFPIQEVVELRVPGLNEERHLILLSK